MTENQLQVEFIDHIGVFKNFVNPEFCQSLIKAFDYWYDLKYIKSLEWSNEINNYSHGANNEGETQFEKGGMGRKDKQFFLEVADPTLAMQVNGAVGQAFELYAKEYKGILDCADPVSSWTTKVQKTEPGGGYHMWHCENGNFMYRDRVLTWMIYLNDIPYENGGATDFYHQKISFQPTEGTIVLWPACYTHMHRGAFLTGDIAKYIATGWFLREPGEVTNRTLGELSGQLQPKEKLNQ